METISKEEGMKLLPLVWTIFLSQSDDLWAEPFSNRKLRYRCFFERTNGVSKKLTVYFHLTEEEANPKNLPPIAKTVYLYGAFNQINVYQIKSFGNIREMDEEEKTNFIELIKKRLTGQEISDKLTSAMSPRESEEARLLIQSGKFYCFEPLEYAYNTYERG